MRVINKKTVVLLPHQINCMRCETYWLPNIDDHRALKEQCKAFGESYRLVHGRAMKCTSPHRCPFFVDKFVGTARGPLGQTDKLWYQKIMAQHNGD